MVKKRFGLILIFNLFVLLLLISSAGDKAWAATPQCGYLEGSNRDMQDYVTYGRVVTSYLLPTEDGNFMRVQWVENSSKLVAEYYNSEFDLVSSKEIEAGLPLFGGFCEYNGYYYVVTGQKNDDQDDSKEVYRLTRYSRDWEKKGEASLYGANTTCPFNAGSCRMTGIDHYLIIRTCHQMYTSSDGRRHQANVTIEADLDNMTVTDSFTSVMNICVGYVSHSFNQFVAMDGNNIVAVDHGDAYPRSIVLQRYSSDASTGKFSQYGNVSYVPVLELYGEIGANATGASVGGFELSDSSYLIAGNSIVQDGKKSTTRNIYLAAVKRTSSDIGEMEFTWLTDYQEGEKGASTPQLVKISGNRFMILWCRENKVYYVEIDGKGRKQGEIHSMDGHLSDCSPVVSGNKLVWYTWEDANTVFYEISMEDYSAKATEIINGHDYDESSIVVDEKGIGQLNCSRCGKTIRYYAPVEMCLYFRDKETKKRDLQYWSYYGGHYEKGESLEVMISYDCGEQDDSLPCFDEFEVIPEDASIVDISKKGRHDTIPTIIMLESKTTHVVIRSKYNPKLTRTITLIAPHECVAKKEIIKASPGKWGWVNHICRECGETLKNSDIIDYPQRIELSKDKYTYNGKKHTPTVRVYDYSGKLIPKSNYTVTYSAGRKKVGKYKVKVTFKGSKYKGSMTTYFKVVKSKKQKG